MPRLTDDSPEKLKDIWNEYCQSVGRPSSELMANLRAEGRDIVVREVTPTQLVEIDRDVVFVKNADMAQIRTAKLPEPKPQRQPFDKALQQLIDGVKAGKQIKPK